MKDSHSAVYQPNENFDERFHRCLAEMYRAYDPHGTGTDWDEILPFVLLAHRSSKHKRTQLTPFFMIYGYEVNLPVDIMFNRAPEQFESKYEYVNQLRERLRWAHEYVRQATGAENIRQNSI